MKEFELIDTEPEEVDSNEPETTEDELLAEDVEDGILAALIEEAKSEGLIVNTEEVDRNGRPRFVPIEDFREERRELWDIHDWGAMANEPQNNWAWSGLG